MKRQGVRTRYAGSSWRHAMAVVVAAMFAFAAMGAACAKHVYAAHLHPVAVVAPARLSLITPEGTVQAPLYLSADWNVPQPGIERAVIVIHGRLRNADVY